ncbi:STM3941 family protein [Mesorhizobium sp. MSK_1335]|uniref:STM3941 family protein n=1 Tax=Mesorhizobium montanum TaxID=3072323 RepID=A0ABU4ZJY0_9HYPH|nr:STM3941 family protein [Mesorhizobium sp. MSK_1335]MDX8525660.1 STM3941 family protein [Mesorhizobium sp. MSK_1335]
MIHAIEPVQPKTIRGSRVKSLFYLLGGIVLVWVGSHAVQDSASRSGLIAVKLVVAGWAGIVFFGLSALGGALSFIRPRALILDRDGFAIGGGIIRSPLKIAWRDIQGFHVRKQNRYKSIGFRFELSAKTRLNRRPGIELSVSGAGWPLSTEKMVETLNAYRLQALNSEAEPMSMVTGTHSAKLSTTGNLPPRRLPEIAIEFDDRARQRRPVATSAMLLLFVTVASLAGFITSRFLDW